MDPLILLLVLSLFVESTTYIFRNATPLLTLRSWISTLHPLLEELLSCGYCLSFWFTFGTLLVYNITAEEYLKLFDFRFLDEFLNFIFCLFIVHRLSGFVHGARDKYFDKSLDKRYINMFDYIENGEEDESN